MPPPEFGSPYQILTEPFPDLDDDPTPRLDGDSLYVVVQYPGGCAEHRFQLHTYTARDSTHLWVEHLQKAETCEALLMDEIWLKMPQEALRARYIGLLPPDHGPAIVVKWGRLR